MLPLNGPGGDPDAIWQRLLLAGEPLAASEALAFEMDRALGMALGFAHVRHAPSALVRDGLAMLAPAELHDLRVSIETELSEKEAVERGLRAALANPAPDGLERPEQLSELARVRAEVAQLLALDAWAGSATEGKSVGWPPERWSEERRLERLWDFHGMQGRLAEALRDYHVLRAVADRDLRRGASPSEDLRLQWNLTEALHAVGELVRTEELAALGRACHALERAYVGAWDRLLSAPANRQNRLFPGVLHEAVRALDGILLVRGLADAYPPQPGLLLPAGARGAGAALDAGAAAAGLAPRVAARAEMRDQVLERYPRYRDFSAAVTTTARHARGERSDAETAALDAARALKKSLGKAYEGYIKAAWSTRMGRHAQACIAEDLRGHAGEGSMFPGDVADQLGRALDDVDAALRDADAALAAARGDAQALRDRLAAVTGSVDFTALRTRAEHLLEGLMFEPPAAPSAAAAARVPAAALADAAAHYSVAVAGIHGPMHELFAASHHVDLAYFDVEQGPARERLFVLQGPAGLPLAEPG